MDDIEEKIKVNSNDWLKQMQEQVRKAMEESMLMVEADAKLNAPVKTGTLRRSITHEVTQNDGKTTGAVGSNVEYAPYVEYKKHYFEEAIDKNKNAIEKKFKNLK